MSIDTAPRLSSGESLTFRSSAGTSAAAQSSAHSGIAAFQFLTDLSVRLSKGLVDLPCFPNVVVKIRDLLNNPRTSQEAVVHLVGGEPRLAAKLVQMANSAAFNPMGNRATDLRVAITRLGFQLVQATAVAFAVQQMTNSTPLRTVAKPLAELWRDSVTVAAIAQLVARRNKFADDEAFLTGLLHGIGRLYILTHALDGAVSQDADWLSLVAEWHPSIGKAILENWQVAEAMSDAVGAQAEHDRQAHREVDLTDILVTSVLLGQAFRNGGMQTLDVANIDAFRRVGLNEADCAAVLRHAQLHLSSLQRVLGC